MPYRLDALSEEAFFWGGQFQMWQRFLRRRERKYRNLVEEEDTKESLPPPFPAPSDMDRQTLLTECRDYIVDFLQDPILPDQDSSSMIVEIWESNSRKLPER